MNRVITCSKSHKCGSDKRYMKNTMIVLLMMTLLISISISEVYAESSTTIDKNAEYIKAPFKKKNPWAALGLSYVLPGAGQFYNGEYKKGTIQLGMTAIGGSVMIGCVLGECDHGTTEYVGLSVFMSGYVWSIIDAPVSTKRINKRNKAHSYGHMIQLQNSEVGIDIIFKEKTPGIQLTMHFL